MTKAFIAILLAILLTNTSQAQSDPCPEFTLHLTKKGGTNDTVRILYHDCSERAGDTMLVLRNGSATYRGAVRGATEAVLFTKVRDRYLDGPYIIRFIVEPGQLNVSFDLVNDTVQNAHVTGARSQIEKEKWDSANAELNVAYEKRLAAAITYIKANPHSYFSGYLLRWFLRSLPLDSAQVYYTSLANHVKQSQFGRDILQYVFTVTTDMNFRKQNSDPAFFSQLEKIKSFHDISLADITGRVHDLSKLKGKFVVVDFWGSWCGPCFANIPELRKLVADMKGKPVEFVSISIDKDLNKYREALKKHHFPGLNLVDTAGVTASYYKVPWVPKYMIIKPDGTIASEEAPFPVSGELKPLLMAIMNRKD